MSTQPFVGDVVATSTAPTDPNTCPNNAAVTPFAYLWEFISTPPGSRAVVSGAQTPEATFVADLQGSYSMRVTVMDQIGLQGIAFNTITTSTCGAIPLPLKPVAANLMQNPNEPFGVGVQVSTADNDPTVCPARFAPTSFTFVWSVTQAPTGAVTQITSPTTTRGTTMIVSLAGQYTVMVVVTDSNGASASSTGSFQVGAL